MQAEKRFGRRVMKRFLRRGVQIRGRIARLYKRGVSKMRNYRFEFCVRHKRGKVLTLDVADMFYMQVANKEFFRYDMIVRYLAIENYYGKNEIGIDLYRRMQEGRIGKDYGDNAVSQFKELIQSYEKNGYDEDSYIVADKNLSLVDGSHRMAMALYHRFQKINVLVINSEHPVDYSIDWFLQKGFTGEEIDLILKTTEKIKEQINTPFSCVIWDPAFDCRDDIIRDLGYFGKVVKKTEYEFRPAEYQNIVRDIYAIDDIESWKIEKKIEYMGTDAHKAVEVEVKFDDPAFRIKTSSGMPLSKRGERAKAALRERYRPQIENYFLDIIMHIGDNHLQSDYMRKVFDPGIDFHEVLSVLEPYKYVLTKMDVPYMPTDFPDRIPTGKDVDILCSREEFPELGERLTAFAKRQEGYEVVVKNFPDRLRLHFELSGKLIFLIDCGCSVDGVPDKFLDFALQTRMLYNGYYVMDDACEAVFRRVTYEADISKEYHLEYYQQHMTAECASMFEKFVKGGVIERLLPEFLAFLDVRKIPHDQICLVGDFVLGIFGIRKQQELEFVVSSNYSQLLWDRNDRETDKNYLENVRKGWFSDEERIIYTDDEIINREELHYKYNGIKIVSLSLLIYKKAVSQKDCDMEDLELIQARMACLAEQGRM